VDLENGSFENVMHVLKLSVNLLSLYRITRSNKGNTVAFTHNSVTIYEMEVSFQVVVGEVNHQSKPYKFYKFVGK